MVGTKFDWAKFIFWGTILILFSIWESNYWLMLGLPIVLDIYVTKKVRWNFWKNRKDGKKPHFLIEWLDAIVFALIAVGLINLYLFQNYKIPTSSLEKSLLIGDHLFVSKVSFGPRNPITPLSFPLAQSTLPIINTKSYIETPQWEYKRLKGFGSIERDNIVVFNFPTGDTITTLNNVPDFYTNCRRYGREHIINNDLPGVDFGEIAFRPVDRRDNYVKRCVAIPGDTFEIKDNWIYVNGKPQKAHEGIQFIYHVQTNGTPINPKIFEQLKIAKSDIWQQAYGYALPLTAENSKKIKALPNVLQVVQENMPQNNPKNDVFPFYNAEWSRDNYGPLWIPKKGTTVDLSIENLPIYNRIINAYEHNKLQVKDSTIYINGEVATSYTFKMDYYFMLGDNRHNSLDSRYWGFVPEDHIVGKPILVWLSLDIDKSFPANIRWDRFFKWVHSDND